MENYPVQKDNVIEKLIPEILGDPSQMHSEIRNLQIGFGEIKNDIRNLKENHFAHLQAGFVELKEWVKKLDERQWFILTSIVIGFLATIIILLWGNKIK